MLPTFENYPKVGCFLGTYIKISGNNRGFLYGCSQWGLPLVIVAVFGTHFLQPSMPLAVKPLQAIFPLSSRWPIA